MKAKEMLNVLCVKEPFQIKAISKYTLQMTERKFKCNLCEKSFKHKHVLDGHVALIHEVKKKYNCASCPEVFDRIATLRDH